MRNGGTRLPPDLLRRLLRRPRPPHVLIEGLDYAGKSSIAAAIGCRLEREGFKVAINNGGLHRGRFRAIAWTLRDRLGPDPLPLHKLYYLDFIYAAVALVDPFGYRADPDAVVIQESYADRMVAYQRGHAIRVYPDVVAALRPLLVPFDVTVCLTISPEARMARFLERTPKRDGTDWEVVTRPEELVRSERELIRLVRRRPNGHVLETSDLTIEETIDRVWELVLPVVEARGRRVQSPHE